MSAFFEFINIYHSQTLAMIWNFMIDPQLNVNKEGRLYRIVEMLSNGPREQEV